MSNAQETTSRTPLLILTAARLLLNTSHRMLYPFLPELSREIGVSLEQMQKLIGWFGGVGLLGSFAVPLSERFGRKPFLLIGYLIFVVGCVSIFIFPTYWVFSSALISIAFAKVLFVANVHATIADIVPYARRGRSIALLELSWGLSLLLGAPAAGWLIARYGWQSPFAVFAVLGLLNLALMGRYIPESHTRTSRTAADHQPVWQTIKAHPSIIAATIYLVCNKWGAQLVFVSYANWMEQEFAVTLGTLGISAVVIGLSELIGEGLCGFSDRIGKKRFVVFAGSLLVICYGVMPLIGRTLETAFIALFMTFLLYEMAVVGALPIYTELAPKARTVVLALVGMASSFGGAIGSFTAPVLSQIGGFQAVSSAAALIMLVGIVAMWLGVKDVVDVV